MVCNCQQLSNQSATVGGCLDSQQLSWQSKTILSVNNCLYLLQLSEHSQTVFKQSWKCDNSDNNDSFRAVTVVRVVTVVTLVKVVTVVAVVTRHYWFYTARKIHMLINYSYWKNSVLEFTLMLTKLSFGQFEMSLFMNLQHMITHI